MSEFAGTLNERVEVERPVGARTPMGVQQSEWESVCRCLASIIPEGVEAEAQALSAMPRYGVTIRWREGIAVRCVPLPDRWAALKNRSSFRQC